MNSRELNAAITAIANILSARLSTDELTYWSIIFSQLGQSLSTIAALNELHPQQHAGTDDRSETTETDHSSDSTLLSTLL